MTPGPGEPRSAAARERQPAAVPGPERASAVLVRERQAADLPGLGQILEAQQPHTGYPQNWPLPFPTSQFLTRPAELAAWVAVTPGGVLLGHVAVTRVEVDSAEAAGWVAGAGRPVEALAAVSVLFVDHTVAGQGVGKVLLDTAVTFIRGQGRTPVLDVVQESTSAVQLYLRRGWHVVGEARPSWLPPELLPVLLMVRSAEDPSPTHGGPAAWSGPEGQSGSRVKP